jgi:hypothetical protein
VMSGSGLGVLAGILWLALALPMFGLAVVSVLAGYPSVLSAGMGVAGAVLAAALITRPTSRPWLSASAVFGMLFGVLAASASLQVSGAWPLLTYGALAAVTAVISAIAASRSPNHAKRPSEER